MADTTMGAGMDAGSKAAIGRLDRRRVSSLRACVAAVLGLLVYLSCPAFAAEAEPNRQDGEIDALVSAFPQGMTSDQLDAMLNVMDDQAVQTALRDRLLAEADGRRAANLAAETALASYGRRFEAIAAIYPFLPEAMADALNRPHGQGQPSSPGRLVVGLFFVLGLGAAAMLFVRRVLAARRLLLSSAAGGSRGQILGRQALRFALDLIGIAAFLAGAVVAFALLRPTHPAAPAILFVALRAAVIVLVAERIATFLCDPDHPTLRFIPITDGPAGALYRTIVIVVLLTVTVAAAVQLFAALGMAPGALIALTLPLSIIPFAYLLLLVWRHRAAITTTFAEQLRLNAHEAPMLGAWPVLATVYLAGLWTIVADAAIRQQPGTGGRALTSLLIIIAIPVLALLIQRSIARFYGGPADTTSIAPPRPTDEYGDALPVAPAAPVAPDTAGHVNRLMRAVWVTLIILAVVVTMRLWGFDPAGWIGLGGVVMRVLFQVGLVLLLAYVGWALVVHAIDRTLIRSRHEGETSRAQRMATLLPLLRKFLKIVLIAILVMVALSSLGIEIGPLLAGAGVVGLALGLGAQSTIADILAGVFFLIEDAFRAGDYVEVGQLRGTVEGISLRSLKLRHHRGGVHTLPFGQIRSLTNYSRDWALVRLEFRVSPGTDLALVRTLIKDIGKKLLADPELGASFIEPLKSQGVRRVEDNALVIGVKYIARAGEQFTIRREAYQRIIRAFAEHGIEFVGRGVVVRVEGAEAMSHAAGAAAAEMIEDLPAKAPAG